MTTNQTIDGVLVSRELLQKWLDDIGPSKHVTQYAALKRDQLRALLDKEVSGDSRAPRPQSVPVAIVLPEFEPAFEKWWEEDGQYCRAGGGSYEKTFAYRAYEAALADVTRLNTK
ncbi:hypothetical protein [Pseudomonas fragi]|uniref:hypothetical protein n=1 Tax=Pseudomonas fragi TaxID=296 RepID=UPI000BA29BE3|nr:hypothetical protein [Pseudomonas fragi]PAA08856.1 hypothetical protein CJU78_09150 [Pseudomonas fragi]